MIYYVLITTIVSLTIIVVTGLQFLKWYFRDEDDDDDDKSKLKAIKIGDTVRIKSTGFVGTVTGYNFDQFIIDEYHYFYHNIVELYDKNAEQNYDLESQREE